MHHAYTPFRILDKAIWLEVQKIIYLQTIANGLLDG